MIEVKKVSKIFTHAQKEIYALNDVSFQLSSGDSLAICGGSGAGKSTLLNLIGGLDQPSSGQVIINGKDTGAFKEKEEAQFRNENLGFVFQFHHLLQDFSIEENIMMPLLIKGTSKKQAKESAQTILNQVSLEKMYDRFPRELSGGEQQRAAIARAIVHKPKLLLADEPTGNLDDENAHHVFELLCELNHDLRATLIMVTHSQTYAKKLNHIIELNAGVVANYH
ncbi:MAG: ABC transporter ATP-binding protein [bacterium]|nr:ABC transporter ATP-binding protein [bacterium]MBU1916614.1 ABC transporter ATP-binding protein [bacterium]